jgi:hypothetical protein
MYAFHAATGLVASQAITPPAARIGSVPSPASIRSAAAGLAGATLALPMAPSAKIVAGDSSPPGPARKSAQGVTTALPTSRIPRPRPADAAIVFVPPDRPAPPKRTGGHKSPGSEHAAAPKTSRAASVSLPVQAQRQPARRQILKLPSALVPTRPAKVGLSSNSVPN